MIHDLTFTFKLYDSVYLPFNAYFPWYIFLAVQVSKSPVKILLLYSFNYFESLRVNMYKKRLLNAYSGCQLVVKAICHENMYHFRNTIFYVIRFKDLIINIHHALGAVVKQ